MIDVTATARMMTDPVQVRLRSTRPDFAKLAAEVFGISKRRLLSRSHTDEDSRARHAGMWVAHEYGYSFAEIGKIFKRHHTTCILGATNVNIYRERWPWYAQACDLILQRARGC